MVKSYNSLVGYNRVYLDKVPCLDFSRYISQRPPGPNLRAHQSLHLLKAEHASAKLYRKLDDAGNVKEGIPGQTRNLAWPVGEQSLHKEHGSL
jgi:hypothetical protein